MIADVATFGYFDGSVLDVTYGLGNFWTKFRPEAFTACDINAEKSPIGYSVDFRQLPFGCEYDCVVFDPPYRLSGTRDRGEFDERFGTDGKYIKWQDVYALIQAGLTECCRVTRKWVMLKCQDQVCSGKMRWQTMDFTAWAEDLCGVELVERFDMLGDVRPQPKGRRVLHAASNYSTLLVFERP